MTHFIADVVSLLLVLSGAFFVFSAAVGLVRFPDTLSRIHAITKPQTVGLILTVLGATIRVIGSPGFSAAERGGLGVMVLLVLFALVTSPVTAQRLGRVARREGLYGDDTHLSINEAPATTVFSDPTTRRRWALLRERRSSPSPRRRKR